MTARKVEIHMTSPNRAEIVVGDQLLKGVAGFTIAGDVKNYTRLTVNLLVGFGVVDGEMVVDIPTSTRESLIALGWTPPEGT